VKKISPERMYPPSRFKPTATKEKICRVLVVDDESEMRCVLTDTLSDFGYCAISANCIEEALNEFKQTEFDLIVTDYNLNGESGLELARKIRETGSRVKIILISGMLENLDQKVLDDLGIEKFYRKPFRMSEFLTGIKEVMKDV
jgi:two-component system, OmpR family, phosphate regulon response regulator OmpR